MPAPSLKVLNSFDAASRPKRIEANFFVYNLTLDRNALVCDPFLGSGSFAIAAAKLKRQVIGVEINKETYEKALLNIAEALTACPPKEEE